MIGLIFLLNYENLVFLLMEVFYLKDVRRIELYINLVFELIIFNYYFIDYWILG